MRVFEDMGEILRLLRGDRLPRFQLIAANVRAPKPGTPFISLYIRGRAYGLGPKRNVEARKYPGQIGFSGRRPGGMWALCLHRRYYVPQNFGPLTIPNGQPFPTGPVIVTESGRPCPPEVREFILSGRLASSHVFFPNLKGDAK